MDRLMFMKVATQLASPIRTKYGNEKIDKFFEDMLEVIHLS